MMGVARWLAGRRWGLARLAVAAGLLWFVAADTGARLARLQYAALPDFDYAGEVSHLREAGRLGEALVVGRAGLETMPAGAAREALTAEVRRTEDESSSVWRRVREFGAGAVTGQGSSLERLLGAVAADMLVIGDVRDLAIQGTKQVLDGDSDEVILALSAVGVATTAAPEIDWAAAVLKAARKAGTLSRGMVEALKGAARTGGLARAGGLMGDAASLARRASPAGALRLVGHADDADELARLARYVERAPRGAFALHVTGREGAELVKRGDATAEAAVALAARKGAAGRELLRTGAYRAVLRPHPLIGLAKGLWKGNVGALAQRAAEALDPHGWWITPLLASWVFVELALLGRGSAFGRDRARMAHASG
ncbi:MAG: hypothetical protein JNM07_04555 [Phycisphaerae bacterium]|nr:hypothetical protein [Phycisphaerae bacterium]